MRSAAASSGNTATLSRRFEIVYVASAPPDYRVPRKDGLRKGAISAVSASRTHDRAMAVASCWTVGMLTSLKALVEDFGVAATAAGVEGWPCEIRTEILRAPHHHPALPGGFGAVYIFALAYDYGESTPAGPGAVLKVGRVGPASGPRFTYQHYGSAAPSTLAKSLVRYRIMWPWLGIDAMDKSSVKSWMLRRLDRGHLYVPAGHDLVLASLEVYVRARVGSVFEGAA
jgi:hypothetical protein